MFNIDFLKLIIESKMFPNMFEYRISIGDDQIECETNWSLQNNDWFHSEIE